MYRTTISNQRLAFVASAVLALAACSEQPTAPRPRPGAPSFSLSAASGIPTGKTVVVFRDTASIPAAGISLIGTLGGVVTTRWDDVGIAFVTGLSANALATLSASALVEAVGNDRILNWLPKYSIGGAVEGGLGTASRDDPASARWMADGSQWGMRVMQADRAWAAGFLGTGTTRVAILDTGIDYDHRELRGIVDRGASTSFSQLIVAAEGVGTTVPVEPQQPGDEPYMDNHFHGTHVGATVASNNISVAGVAPLVTLVAVKVLNFLGSGSFESVASGIRHASHQANAHVINMSLGTDVDPSAEGVPALLQLMSRTIRAAEKKGTIVISAAGNDAINLDAGTVVYTPCEQSTICVSATGPINQQDFDQAATYTNYGITAIEVAAPGGNSSDESVTKDLIIGACSRRATEPGLAVCRANTDGVVYFYVWAAGTSMATPHVAGEAALVKSYFPTLSIKGLRERILKTADDVQVPGRDVYTNWGRINVAKALGLAGT